MCAAAAEAYFDAYIEKKSEGEANEAAAVAYVEALDKVENIVVCRGCVDLTSFF